jgi:hypothetical protein
MCARTVHGVQDKLLKVIWPKFDYFSGIAHLSVKTFKEGTFGILFAIEIFKIGAVVAELLL